MSKDTEPLAKPGTATIVPARARDIVPGSVVHTFAGDLRVDAVFVTPSGFLLAIQYDGSICPFRAEDMVCLVAQDGAA